MRCRRELGSVDYHELGGVMVADWCARADRNIFKEAIRAGVNASKRTRTRPSASSITTIALEKLRQRLVAELAEMIERGAIEVDR